MTKADMPELAALIHDALHSDASAVAQRTTTFRQRFTTPGLHQLNPATTFLLLCVQHLDHEPVEPKCLRDLGS